MEITIQYFDGCPHWKDARGAVADAVRLAGLPEAPIKLQLVDTAEEAERLGFRGSPTILIDGVDPFAEPDAQVGLMCRIFRTEHGLAGVPSPTQLQAALRAVAGR